MSTLFYSSPPSLSLLYEWLASRSIITHAGIVIKDGPYGWQIVSEQAIPRGSVLCSVPTEAIFSHRTASLRRIIDLEAESPTEAVLCLTACLLHELRLGEKSDFYGWLQHLPRETIILPTFWSDESLAGPDGVRALDLLRGTEAERELQRKDGEGLSLTDLKDFYERVLPHLPPTKAQPGPSPFAAFAYAFSMVSTRGFVIDNYHIIGMVPFCDMFNHSSEAHTSLASNGEVCPECGSYAKCEHDQPDDAPSRLADVPRKPSSADNVVDMRAERDIPVGAEVLSCYEEDTGDGKLLVEWGFIEGGRHSKGLTWPREGLVERETIREWADFAQRPRQSGPSLTICQPPSNQPFALGIDRQGRVCDNLVAAVTLLHVKSEPGSGQAAISAVLADLSQETGVLSDMSRQVVQHVLHLVTERGARLADVNPETVKTEPLTYLAARTAADARQSLDRVERNWARLLERASADGGYSFQNA